MKNNFEYLQWSFFGNVVNGKLIPSFHREQIQPVQIQQ